MFTASGRSLVHRAASSARDVQNGGLCWERRRESKRHLSTQLGTTRCEKTWEAGQDLGKKGDARGCPTPGSYFEFVVDQTGNERPHTVSDAHIHR